MPTFKTVNELSDYIKDRAVEEMSRFLAIYYFLDELEVPLAEEDFIKIKQAISQGLPIELGKQAIAIINPHDPAIGKHTEMRNVLGLQTNTAWSSKEGTASVKSRYQTLSDHCQVLPFENIKIGDAVSFVERIQQVKPGEYLGFNTGWKGHGFSIHVIQDKDVMHFIYVNRAKWLDVPADDLKRKILIFSCDATQKSVFAQQFYEVFSSQDKDTILKFILSMVATSHFNKELSQQFNKSAQNTGNCTIANTNIVWHFYLAAQRMQQTPAMNFIEAYQATKDDYKKLRMADRLESFLYLMKSAEMYPDKAAFHQDIMQVMIKFYQKDKSSPGRSFIEKAVERLSQESPVLLAEFNEIISSELFKSNIAEVQVKKWTLNWADKLLLKDYKEILQKDGLEKADIFLNGEDEVSANKIGCRSFRTTKKQDYSLMINELSF